VDAHADEHFVDNRAAYTLLENRRELANDPWRRIRFGGLGWRDCRSGTHRRWRRDQLAHWRRLHDACNGRIGRRRDWQSDTLRRWLRSAENHEARSRFLRRGHDDRRLDVNHGKLGQWFHDRRRLDRRRLLY